MSATVTALHPEVAPPATLHATRAVLPNLDGIRAMACILVVLSHMPWSVKFETLGEVGVGVFFVLSGFLMSHLYAGAPWDTASVCRYAVARFARIAPVYWLVISVCILISYARPEDHFLLRIEGVNAIVRHYLFGGNVLIFWSIPLEVQYYVFFVFVWWAIASSQQRVYALPLLALVCVVLLVTHTRWTGLMLPHKLHFFLAGTLAGLVPRPAWQAKSETWWLSLLQLAAFTLLALPLWMYSSKPALYEASVLGLSMALAVYLLAIPSPWTRVVFASPLVRKIGQASFSIYLMHVLVFHYGMQLLGLQHDVFDWRWLPLGIAGVALPMLASHYVELPLQRMTRSGLERRLGLSTLAGIRFRSPGVHSDLH
jgi:peptidoglycan/LPS O-acetylase OafA/YrhL